MSSVVLLCVFASMWITDQFSDSLKVILNVASMGSIGYRAYPVSSPPLFYYITTPSHQSMYKPFTCAFHNTGIFKFSLLTHIMHICNAMETGFAH
jgi:hypothetical protein